MFPVTGAAFSGIAMDQSIRASLGSECDGQEKIRRTFMFTKVQRKDKTTKEGKKKRRKKISVV